MVKVKLNDNQFSALVSLAYNLGLGNFKKSTLLRLVINGDFKGASEQFVKWKFNNEIELAGSLRRREAERNFF